MTKASDNIFPSMLYVEGTTPSSPSAGQQRLFVRSSDHVLCMVNSSGTVTPLSGSLTNPMTTAGDIIYGGASGVPTRLAGGTSGYVLTSNGATSAPSWQAGAAGGLIGFAQYAVSTVYSIASATLADIDATNLLVTFTAPASGNVLVRLTGLFDTSVGTQGQFLHVGLRESTTQVGLLSTVLRAPDTAGGMRSPTIYVSGISAGSHTYKVAWAMDQTNAATGRLIVNTGASTGAVGGPATIEVFAAP